MRLACSVLLLACACGTLSNEDIAFLEAMPQKESLHVVVPKGSSSQNACAIGPADVWISAKTTGDSINAGVDGILALIDAIRAVPPTTRDTDSRTWGPFPDQPHPGVEIQVTMFRELDESNVPWRWIYTISGRRKPGGFLPVLEGEFFGAQARKGVGRLTLHFENVWTLNMNKPDDPRFPMRIFYDLAGDPRTVSLDLTVGMGFGLPSFDYGYAGYLDGHGRFDYAVPQPNGCVVEVTTLFTAQGAGKDTFRVRCGPLVLGDVHQCWDVSACLTYVDDPIPFTPACNGAKPCLLGSIDACPKNI